MAIGSVATKQKQTKRGREGGIDLNRRREGEGKEIENEMEND